MFISVSRRVSATARDGQTSGAGRNLKLFSVSFSDFDVLDAGDR
jgi:hypothetical protein